MPVAETSRSSDVAPLPPAAVMAASHAAAMVPTTCWLKAEAVPRTG